MKKPNAVMKKAECCDEKAECCDEKAECCDEKAECCDEKAECCDEKAECCDEVKIISEKHTLPQLEIPSPNIETPPLSNEVQSETVNRLTFFESDDALLSDVKTLSQYVELILHTTDIDNKYSLVIDDKSKKILELLLKESNYFENIENKFKLIIKDNKIDASDVPLLMNLLVELYAIIKNNNKKIYNCSVQ